MTNTCGFLCGRCQFLYYSGKHPEHECCTFYRECYGRGIDEEMKCCCYCFQWNVALNTGGYIASLPMALCYPSFGGNIVFAPAIATASCTGLSIVHACIGCTTYNCARNMKKTQFTESYERGQICLPGDTCSFTSLRRAFWNFWNPCCGESKDVTL